LIKKGTNRSNRAQLIKQEYQLEQLTELGIQEIKQAKLWNKWRKVYRSVLNQMRRSSRGLRMRKREVEANGSKEEEDWAATSSNEE
jgi:hypothetical protein